MIEELQIVPRTKGMKTLPLLTRGTSGVAVLFCVGLAFIVIYGVCFCLYAAIAVAIDSIGSNASVGQRIADMIRAPFGLLLGPLSSVEGSPPPSPHPQILAIALTVTVGLTVTAYLMARRGKRKG
jgi:hypothetical protein